MKIKLFYTVIIAYLISFLLFAGGAWGATWYVDKRCANNGNGTAASCAAGAGQAGAWNSPSMALQSDNVSASTHTINVVTGSGPYLSTDFTFISLGYFYPQQVDDANITWNWNGNTVQIDTNVNTGTYAWHQSTGAGKTDWYYLTLANGNNPSLTRPKTAVVNNYWSAESTNLVNITGFTLYGHYATDNWGWGDFDTLGYSTLYVRYNNGVDPTGGNPVYITAKDYVIRIANGTSTFTMNDGIFRGANIQVAYIEGCVVNFNRSKFYNADLQGIQFQHVSSSGSTIKHSVFDSCGHRGINNDVAAVNFSAYNNDFINVHLMLRMAYNGAYTVNFKNNISYNLLAGGIQHDLAAATLVESNNQFHIDPASTHGDKAISFTAGTRQWTTTAASDNPANAATSTVCTNAFPACGTDPLFVSSTDYRLQASSPAKETGTTIQGIHDRSWTDYSGTTFQGRGATSTIY
jgi:hypothetical protein